MNEQEIIQQLIYLKNDLEGLKYNSCASKRMEEALNKAIKALEKQIPKKPIFVDVRFRHHGKYISDGQSLCKCYKCPNCNTHMFHVFDDEKYCKRCGQKLDWTVEE